VAILGVSPALARAGQDNPAPVEAEGASTTPPAAQPAPPQPVATPPASLYDDRPFARIVPNFITDLRRLPSLDTAVVLGVGGLLSAAAYNNDAHFTKHASAGGTDQIFEVGGTMGDGYVQAGIAVGVYAAGRLSKSDATAHIGADLIRAQLVTGLLVHSLKLATQRDRPNGTHDSATKTYAFPSGHSAATWTTATVLWRHLGWRVGVPASFLAAYASASRLQQNQHYMSDVLFGAALGIASARTATIGHGQRRLAVTPVPMSGGGAVMFTMLPN
jgi:membrane-associated phospholipid phosphatase